MTTRLVVYAFSNHQTISNPLKSWPRASQSCSWQDESSCVAPSPQKWLSAIAIIWKTHQLASWTSKLWAAHSHGRCSWHKQLSECPVWSKHESVKREEWKALETTMERISQWNYMELCYMNIMHSLLFHTIAQAGGWPFEIAPLSLCHMARHNSTWASGGMWGVLWFKPIQHLSTCFSTCFKMFKRDFVLCAKARNFTQPSGPGHVPQCSNLQSEKSASLHVSTLGDRKAQILNLTTHGTM